MSQDAGGKRWNQYLKLHCRDEDTDRDGRGSCWSLLYNYSAILLSRADSMHFLSRVILNE